jgi:hypothetical protein
MSKCGLASSPRSRISRPHFGNSTSTSIHSPLTSHPNSTRRISISLRYPSITRQNASCHRTYTALLSACPSSAGILYSWLNCVSEAIPRCRPQEGPEDHQEGTEPCKPLAIFQRPRMTDLQPNSVHHQRFAAGQRQDLRHYRLREVPPRPHQG